MSVVLFQSTSLPLLSASFPRVSFSSTCDDFAIPAGLSASASSPTLAPKGWQPPERTPAAILSPSRGVVRKSRSRSRLSLRSRLLSSRFRKTIVLKGINRPETSEIIAPDSESAAALQPCTLCAQDCELCRGASQNPTASPSIQLENSSEYSQHYPARRSPYETEYDTDTPTWRWPSMMDAGYRIGPVLSSKARFHQPEDKRISSAYDAFALQSGKRKLMTLDWAACESEMQTKRRCMTPASSDNVEEDDGEEWFAYGQSLVERSYRSQTVGFVSGPLTVEDADLLLSFSKAAG